MARCTSWDLCLLAWVPVDGRVSDTCDATATAFRALGNKGSNLELWWPWTFWSVKMIPQNSLRLFWEMLEENFPTVCHVEKTCLLQNEDQASSMGWGCVSRIENKDFAQGYDIIQKWISPRDVGTHFLFLYVFFVFFFFFPSIFFFCLFVSCQGFFLCLN